MVPAAFPLYTFLSDKISWQPVYKRAKVIDNSFASVPEFMKNTTYILIWISLSISPHKLSHYTFIIGLSENGKVSTGNFEATASAKSATAWLRYKMVECCKILVWFIIALTTLDQGANAHTSHLLSRQKHRDFYCHYHQTQTESCCGQVRSSSRPSMLTNINCHKRVATRLLNWDLCYDTISTHLILSCYRRDRFIYLNFVF